MTGERRLSAIGSSLAIHGALVLAAWLTLRGGHEHRLIWIAAEPAADSVVALGSPARAGVARVGSGAVSATKSGSDSGAKPGLDSGAESAAKSGSGQKGNVAAGGAGLSIHLSIHPRYPRASRALGEEGAVVLQIRISPDGRISDVRLVRSSGFRRLDDAAIAAAQAASLPPKSAPDSAAKSAEDSAGIVREITVRFRLNDPPD